MSRTLLVEENSAGRQRAEWERGTRSARREKTRGLTFLSFFLSLSLLSLSQEREEGGRRTAALNDDDAISRRESNFTLTRQAITNGRLSSSSSFADLRWKLGDVSTSIIPNQRARIIVSRVKVVAFKRELYC